MPDKHEPGGSGKPAAETTGRSPKPKGVITMKKEYKDGWHKVAGYDVYIENGLIVRGTIGTGYDYRTAYPYIAAKDGGWDNASRELTPEAFRARVRRGTATMR